MTILRRRLWTRTRTSGLGEVFAEEEGSANKVEVEVEVDRSCFSRLSCNFLFPTVHLVVTPTRLHNLAVAAMTVGTLFADNAS